MQIRTICRHIEFSGSPTSVTALCRHEPTFSQGAALL